MAGGPRVTTDEKGDYFRPSLFPIEFLPQKLKHISCVHAIFEPIQSEHVRMIQMQLYMLQQASSALTSKRLYDLKRLGRYSDSSMMLLCVIYYIYV